MHKRNVVLFEVCRASVCRFHGAAHFVFHSAEAVKALFYTAIASIGTLAPGILRRIEYQLTETGLAKRPFQLKQPREFQDVFSWDQLSYVIPTKSRFKFYRKVEAPNSMLGFLKLHLSDKHSGEIHVESEDRDRLRAIFEQRGIPMSKPSSAGRRGTRSRG